jgi:putative DNA primase/helicase
VSDKDTADRLLSGALWYANNEWKIHPCYGIVDGKCTCNSVHQEPKDVGKHPRLAEWNKVASSNPEDIKKWWSQDPYGNIGVLCRDSGFLVIDIDPRSGGQDSFDKFEELVNGALPPTIEATTGEYVVNGKTVKGRHLFYKCDSSEQLLGNLNRAGLKGIDIKHNGYVLIAPSVHFSGVSYEWPEGHAPWEIEMAEAPEELLSSLRKRSRRSTTLGVGDWSAALEDLDFSGEKIDVNKMLEEGIDEGSRAVDIYKLTCALANKMEVGSEYGRLAVETLMIRFNAEKIRPPMDLEGPNGLLMHVRNAINFVLDNPKTERMWPGLTDFQKSWAQRSQEETEAALAHKPRTVKQLSGADMTREEFYALPGTIGGRVSEHVHDDDDMTIHQAASNIDIPKDPDALYEEDGGEPGRRTLSDTGNGRRLVDTFGSAIRYTPGLGWFHWSNRYWKPDAENLEIQELAKRISPIIASEVVNYEDPDKQGEVVKWATQSKSNSRLKSAIENSNSDPRIIVPVDNWDSDENLLGVMNGVIDLKTGELLKGRPDLYITRRAPVAYNPGIKNVRWEQFLDFATGGDKEYQDWLQRAAGYSLTGSNKYDIMFLVYGPPGSGKNTFVEALVKCLGTQQYAWPLDSSILAANDGQSSSTDLYHWAELRGRRMVWVDELPDSERLKENSIKKLTGSSSISARSPGEKPFTFESQAKLWISTNHRPIITDDAMWRRIRPIPFNKVPDNPDPDLKEYIFDPEGALPAVLSWAVEGAIKMLGSGSRDALGWCSRVTEAADIYRKNEDRIGIFLDEETNEIGGAQVQIKSLYTLYRMWSDERGERPMTQIAFQRKLSDRNLDVVGTGAKAVIKGYALAPRSVPNGEVDWGMASRFAR